MKKNIQKQFWKKFWKIFFLFFCRFFQYYGHIFWLKSIFSGKITILSYKTIFGPTYSVISGNLVEQFFRKFQKHVILGQNGHFLARLAKIGQNENFYKKSGRAIFLPLLSPNFMPSFRKIVRAVSEINSLDIYYVSYWTSESDWFYGITLVCICSLVSNELISKPL